MQHRGVQQPGEGGCYGPQAAATEQPQPAAAADVTHGADTAAGDGGAAIGTQHRPPSAEHLPDPHSDHGQDDPPLPLAPVEEPHACGLLSSGPVLERILTLSGCPGAIALSRSTCINTWSTHSLVTWCCSHRTHQDVLVRAARAGSTRVLQALLLLQEAPSSFSSSSSSPPAPPAPQPVPAQSPRAPQQAKPQPHVHALALAAAAAAGQLATVQLLLEHVTAVVAAPGAPGSCCSCRATPEQQHQAVNEALRQACSEGQAAVCRLLLEHPTCEAAHASRSNMAQFMLLRVAAERDQPEVARVLLDQPARVRLTVPNANSALIWAAMHGHQRTVQAMVEHPSGVCDVNGHEGEPLKVAAMRNRRAVCEYLVRRGADTTLRDSFSMRVAAMNGHAAVVKLLLAHGAHGDACDSMALLYAAGPRGCPDMVRALLEAPCHPAHADAQHSQALRAAAIGGRFNACRLLLAAPRHPARLEDCPGVVHEAAARGHHKVLKVLQEAYLAQQQHPHHQHHQQRGEGTWVSVMMGAASPSFMPGGLHGMVGAAGGVGSGAAAAAAAFLTAPHGMGFV